MRKAQVLLLSPARQLADAPPRRQRLKQYFNKEPLKINLDEAIVFGAAVQGGLSISIETAGGVFTKLVPYNTVIPVSQLRCTVHHRLRSPPRSGAFTLRAGRDSASSCSVT